jgi:hypothetical protein
MGSFRTITVLCLKNDLIVLGAGDSASFDFIGDSKRRFGYQLYFFGSWTGCASELALVDPLLEPFA